MHRRAARSKTGFIGRSAIDSERTGVASKKRVTRFFRSASVAVAAVALAGCAAPRSEQGQILASTQGSKLVRGARVTDVRDISMHQGGNAVLGGIVGTVLGGLAGSSIGGGNGSAVAGIGGAIAGGAAGQKLERSAVGTSHASELTVQFDNGDVGTYQVDPGQSFRVGERVVVTSSAGRTTVTH
jgi:outer membrane lipoprotein SlyB